MTAAQSSRGAPTFNVLATEDVERSSGRIVGHSEPTLMLTLACSRLIGQLLTLTEKEELDQGLGTL